MDTDFPIITTNQYVEHASKWLDAIKRGEDLSVVFFPKTDRSIRLGQLINDKNLTQKILGSFEKYIFLPVNFDEHDVEDLLDLEFQVQERLNSLKLSPQSLTFDKWMRFFEEKSMYLILVIPEAEKFLSETGKEVLTILTELTDKYRLLVRIICFFEVNIGHPSVLNYLPSSASLYENIFYYPLYDEGTSSAFMNMIAKQWDVDLTTMLGKKILAACGGHFWLIKESLRRIAAHENWSSEHEGMQFRLRSIYSLLLESEQKLLHKLALRQSDYSSDEKICLGTLKKMRVIDKKNELSIGAFLPFLLRKGNLSIDLDIQDGHVLMNKIPIDRMFSRKEKKLLHLLLEKKNKLVSRDEIALVLWDNRADFSDWALDQLVARVRRRLVELSLSPETIQVVRGKGYKMQL